MSAFDIETLRKENATFYDFLDKHTEKFTPEEHKSIDTLTKNIRQMLLASQAYSRVEEAAKALKNPHEKTNLIPDGCLGTAYHLQYLHGAMTNAATENAYKHYSSCKNCLKEVFTFYMVSQAPGEEPPHR